MLELPALPAYFALVLSSSLAIGALIFAARMWAEKDLPEARAGLRTLGTLDAPAFTELVARAWAAKGHLVRGCPDAAHSPGLRVLSDGHEWLIDCRHRRDEQVEPEHLRSLMHAVDGAAVAGGILVSAGYCSDSLKRSTRGERLRVVDGAGLWQLLEPALSPKLRRRAGIRISLLRGLRVGLPLLAGLALGVLALMLAWHLLAESPDPMVRPPAARAAALTPPAPEHTRQPERKAATPTEPDAITAERAAPASQRGSPIETSPGTTFGHGAGGTEARDRLIADLEALSEVREAWWSADSQVQMSVQSAISQGTESAEQICNALGSAGLGTAIEVRYQIIGNHGFEASTGMVGCR
jgi:hypothetical protein